MGELQIPVFKSGRTQSFLTGSTFRGEALKERSEGSWRSGRRRSEGCRRRGHGQRFSSIPCRAGYPFSTPCARPLPISDCRLPIDEFSATAFLKIGNRKLAIGNTSVSHCHLALESDGFLIIRIDGDGAECVLSSLAPVTTFKKNSSQKNMRVDQFRIPEYRRLQRCYRSFLIAAAEIDSTAQQVGFCVCWFNHDDAMEFRECFLVTSGLVKVASLD